MEASFKLGSVWGIPIGLHTSWFLIFILLTWSLMSGYFPEEYPQLSSVINFIMALITSSLFFGSVLAHELGHSFVALRNKIPVRGITLFIFGGVAQIGQEPRSPGVEFRVAIAGPAVSLALAAAFGGLWLMNKAVPVLSAPSLYLMRINFLLAVFNMIPGFPLDGGRVLRAGVWWYTKSFHKASQVAAFSGQLVAFAFIGFGIYTILRGQFLNGLWLAFIGWFLQNAAASTYAQTTMQRALQGITVEQVMDRNCPTIPGLLPISHLVEERILTGGQRCFFVVDNGSLLGMLTLRDITQIPRPKWGFTTARQAMIPMDRLIHVDPKSELLSALQIMDNANVNQVPVVKRDELVGVVSREQIVHYLRTRAELGI